MLSRTADVAILAEEIEVLMAPSHIARCLSLTFSAACVKQLSAFERLPFKFEGEKVSVPSVPLRCLSDGTVGRASPFKRQAAIRVALKLAWSFVAQSVEYRCGYTPSFAPRPRPI